MTRLEATARGLALARYGTDKPDSIWQGMMGKAEDIMAHDEARDYARRIMAVQDTAEQWEVRE